MRRPRYFGCWTVPPRSTPTSMASSSRTRSTAVSRAARAIILGIEEFGVEQGDIAHFAFALGPRLAEIDHAGPSKLLDPFQGFALGLEHGVDEVQAAALVGEHLRDEQPLLHLAAALGALPHQRTLVVDLLAVGQLRR